MPRTEFIATGHHVPERVVANEELAEYWDTSDAWIRARSGIETRRWVEPRGETGSDLALEATRKALDSAGMPASALDCIIYATLSPEHYFPGGGVFLQRKLGVPGIPALDVRNQCSGFLYGLSIADGWIRTGQYRRVLLVGAEVHSLALEYDRPEGRNVGVLFGDGAGAAILGPTEDDSRGIMGVNLFADGRFAELLWVEGVGMRDSPWLTRTHLDEGKHYPRMAGREVFRHAVKLMPEALRALLDAECLGPGDIDLLVAHQANLRINEAVAHQLGLDEERVYNNVQRYGNTTAATIPIALDECVHSARLHRGDLLGLVAFGSGFTWGSALVRW